MPGRKREPSFQLASGTTNERDNSYNISSTLGSIFYNTDTSNVEIRHEDPSNTLEWRDLVMNNKEQIDISGKLVVDGTIEMNSKIKFPNRPFVVAGRSAGRVYAPNDFVFNVEAHNTGFLNNGKFTAPSGFPGYYSFTFTGLGGSMESAPNTRWYLNNSLIPYGAAHVNASFVSTSAHNRHGLSCHVCVHLEEGDFVTLRVHTGSVYGGQTAHTTVVAMYLFTP